MPSPRDYELGRHLDGLQQTGDQQWICNCPIHEDSTPSLSVGIGKNDKLLLHCQAGCSTAEIIQHFGLGFSSLFAGPPPHSNGKHPRNRKRRKGKRDLGPPVAIYDYTDEHGTLLYQSVRYHPRDKQGKADKTFLQRRPDPAKKGRWIWSVKGCRKVLYRLPEIVASSPETTILITEGEKDVDNLRRGGFVATCNVGGAGKWLPGYTEQLRGRRVAILPDNDEPGRKHAEHVAEQLDAVAASVKIIHLGGLPEKGDASDWIAAGHKPQELREAIEAAPLWEKPEPDGEPDGTPAVIDGEICNGVYMLDSVHPLKINDIVTSIFSLTDHWPRRVRSSLFAHKPGGPVHWIERTSSLFGFIGSATGINPKFYREVGCHTKEEVFEEVRRTAIEYQAVETLPHEPPIEDHYYACETPEPGNGDALLGLVKRFNPATPVDADLIICMLATVIWGGPSGSRPAFLITSDDGRGSGKTKMASMVGHLAGGIIEVSATSDADKVKERLLSPEGVTKRVALLDNVKTLRFSWAELESLITAPVISGKRLYVGEWQRPNNLTWIITLNGASLSTDMAQRCAVLKINRPVHSGDWEAETREYITANRLAIIGDLVAFLREERNPLNRYTRWGKWERDVLERLPGHSADEVQHEILARQESSDVEHEESDLIVEHFQKQIERYHYDPEEDSVFIPNSVATKWYNEATNERHSTIAVGRLLKQRISEKSIVEIQKCRMPGGARGFYWQAKHGGLDSEINGDLETRIDEEAKKKDRGF